jgi:aminodeoxyfutalosine deaminase
VQLLQARWLLANPDTLHGGGGVLLRGGRVVEVLESPAQVARVHGAVVHDLGDVLLAPGLINAHAHLDLTALGGRVSAEGGFAAWVPRLLHERATTDAAVLTGGLREGADRLLATGTTWVGDVDSTGLATVELARHALPATVYREVLDGGDPARTGAAFDSVAEPLEAPLEMDVADASPRREGLSPHAPFTVSPPLLARLGQLARARGLPLAIHWSETEAELDWLERGGGPLAALLQASPGRSGLDLLEQAGLLGARTALIHGNYPGPGEPERLAAAGVTLVHCPGTHKFFGRPEAPLARYREAGVCLALGTDSRASNQDLDLRAEMVRLRDTQPSIEPREVWRMATQGGARAIGVEDTGSLYPGARADLAAFVVSASCEVSLLDELTAGQPRVRGVWAGGVRWSAPSCAGGPA